MTFQNDAEVAQDFSGVTNAEVLSSKLFQPSTVRTVASPDATQAFNDPIPNYLCAPLAMIQPCSPFLRKREAAPQLPPPAVKVSPTATASPAAIASPTATTSQTATASPVPAASPAAPVYPPPVVSHSKKWISCYFLEGAQANTAVLSVPSFLDDTASDDPLVLEWQVVAKSCISKIKAAGKTSLILDMRSNNGGKITAGYFLLQQLFPNQTHFMGTRMRANSGLNLVGKEVERLANKNLKKPSAVQNAVLGNSFNYKQNVDTAGAKFPSWAAMYGPRPNGFTNVFRDDLSDIAYLKNDTGIDLTRAASQPFLASRIKILTDGYCTSTCHSFGALMAQAGVQSVYVGGRPQAGVPKAFGGTGGTVRISQRKNHFLFAEESS